MREDKLIRSGDSGIDGALLRAAKRAVQAGDAEGFNKVLEQLSGLCDLAAKSKDGELTKHYRALADHVGRIVKTRGAAVVMETKSLAASKRAAISDDELEEVASADPIGSISGYGAIFNNVDLGGDVILPGAFRRSLDEWRKSGRLPVMLAQHDSRVFPVGAWTSMSEDSRGLRVKGNVANTPRGREAWALINMRPSALDGLSIGYSAGKSNYRSDGARELKDLDLFEISIVSLPMNPLARLELGKSADDLSTALQRLKRVVADQGSNVVQFPRASDAKQIEEQISETLAALALQMSSTNLVMRMKKP